MMNDIEKYFRDNRGRIIRKWDTYFEVYDRYFSRYRGTDVHLLEIGVCHGGSLQMWKHYFGEKAMIYGVDVNPNCRDFEEDRVKIFIGDQANKKFLHSLKDSIPRIDILIDDGGHKMNQQINTFEVLYPYLAEDGIYICEDVHTSYWKKYSGGFRKRGTFIEYSKDLIDYVNAWHSRQPIRFKVNDFSRSTLGVHFYDSMVAIEKKPRKKPQALQSGTRTVAPNSQPLSQRIAAKVRRKIDEIVSNIFYR